MKRFIVLLSVCLFLGNLSYAKPKDPVAVLFQVKGKVQYTKNGRKWKKVRNSKFLFTKYQIRTSPRSSGIITIQKTGENYKLGENSVFTITKNGIQIIKGTADLFESSNKLTKGLIKRFTKSQSYTTVRRSNSSKKSEIKTARKTTLSDSHPDMAWNNIGSQYNYELIVGGKVYQVPSTNQSVVRLKIEPFTGTQTFVINVKKGNQRITSLKPYKIKNSTSKHTISWLEESQKSDIEDSLDEIKATYGTNFFMTGSFFEKQNMWIAAMDQYKRYLVENPDEIEMSPYLFKMYKKLKLNTIYSKELKEYKEAMRQ